MDTKTYSIAKLNGTNYFLWRLKIEMLLHKEKLWSVIVDGPPETITDEWRGRDQSARATIGLTLEDKVLFTIAHCRSAKQVWEYLKHTYEHKGLSSKLILLKKLYGIRYDSHSNMEEYLNEIQEFVHRLSAIGEDVKDSHLIAIMLCGLPESFNPIITAIETREEGSVSVEYVMERLRGEAVRRESSKEDYNSPNLALNSTSNLARRNIICHGCGNPGHIRRNCPNINRSSIGSPADNVSKPRANFQSTPTSRFNSYYSMEEQFYPDYNNEPKSMHQKDSTSSEWALNGQESTEKINYNEWIIDSGASSHMTPSLNCLKNASKLSPPLTVEVANGEKVSATHTGDMEIYVRGSSSGKLTCLSLSKVLYVPNFKSQLLSVPALCQDNYEVCFDKNACLIYLEKELCVKGDRKNKSYVMEGQTREIAMVVKPCLHVWHQRLGHRSLESIKDLYRNKIAKNIEIGSCNHSNFCPSCQLGGMTQAPFKRSTNQTTQPFKGLVADLCGPITPCTLGGKKYFLTVTDDFSNYTQVCLLSNKFQATENLIRILKEGYNKFNHMPEFVRTDEGGEFLNHELDNFLKENGIRHQTSVVHTPQQNGKAERKNRTLVTMTRSMLQSARLPLSLWGEAINTATYILNRLQHSAQLKTPFELWNGKAPSLEHLRGFGCVAYALINKSSRKKLDPTSIRGVMVGYGQNKKCFRLWIPGTSKIVNAISVRFHEEIMNESEHVLHPKEIDNYVDLEINISPQDCRKEAIRKSERSTKGVPPEKLDL